jgi:hypothetical protein
MASLLLALALPAWAEGPASGGTSPAPGTAPQFKPGDVLAVAAERADVMLGSERLATLPRGQRFVVVEARDEWIGVRVSVAGQSKAGWVRSADIVPREALGVAGDAGGLGLAAGPQTRSVFRPTSPETPQPVPVVRVSPALAGGDHWDAYMVGKYDRHEVDPNVHSWEPWRQR